MPTVLIELPGGAGMVRRDDGEIALMHDVASEWGQPLQPHDRYQVLRVGLDGDRMLFGGLLPPGAVSVEAVEATGARKAAAVGGGTYAVIFEDGEHGEPALAFRDATGGFVHRPMPAEYRRQPVTDAEEPCPVCGAVQYDEYFPTEQWRGGTTGPDGSRIPSPIVICRVCGHEEKVGAIQRYAGPDPDGDDEAAAAARMARIRAEQMVQRWYANKITLMAVKFPIYAAVGWPARLNGSGSQGDDLTSLTIAHAETLPDEPYVVRPQLEVTTSIDPHQPSELAVARDAYASLVDAEANRRPTDDLSDAALTLWFRAARRRRLASSHAAPVTEVKLRIDGTRQAFVMVGTVSPHWVAVRRHQDLTITIAGRDLDPATLTIEPIADPAARLLGPKPQEPG